MSPLLNYERIRIGREKAGTPMPEAKPATLIDECLVADSFFARFVGLLGRRGIPERTGLLLKGSNDIHMWGMRFPIDAIFLKRAGPGAWEITSIRENLRPFRLLPVRDGAAEDTLEVSGGFAGKHQLRKGDRLCIA